jgi:hypothetical protein
MTQQEELNKFYQHFYGIGLPINEKIYAARRDFEKDFLDSIVMTVDKRADNDISG